MSYVFKHSHGGTIQMPIEECFRIQYYDDLIKPNGDAIHRPFVRHTKFIAHRINQSQQLQQVPPIFGVEVDVRENQNTGKLMLVHDPFQQGQDLQEYLQHFQHSTLILNIKSERIEPYCLQVMKEHGIKDFFFLDSSFPMMVALSRGGVASFATRLSEYEPLPEIGSEWVWVDCFSSCTLTKNVYEALRKKQKKICVVSPELQGRPSDIQLFRSSFIENGIVPDAICCKVENIVEWI